MGVIIDAKNIKTLLLGDYCMSVHTDVGHSASLVFLRSCNLVSGNGDNTCVQFVVHVAISNLRMHT